MLRVMLITEKCPVPVNGRDTGMASRVAKTISEFSQGRMQAAVACMADGSEYSVYTANGITWYYLPVKMCLGTTEEEWKTSKEALLRAIKDFVPDIIHCFGTEWPYGAIAEDVQIPVAIHMLGFLNIYYTSLAMATWVPAPRPEPVPGLKRRIIRRIKGMLKPVSRETGPTFREVWDSTSAFERRVTAVNRYYLGHTEWDRNIVRYYSPGARYYYVPEPMNQLIYEAAGQWKYKGREKIRLLTVSSGDDRKGNEIILRTARLLKDLVKLDFTWYVTGSTDFFSRYEERTGILHGDVNVELIGWIDSARVKEELLEADLFIHPSIMDNSPYAVCEAQLAGCPVIASNVGGVPALVEHGVTGFLYPYNEPHTLAFLIGTLCRDGETLTRVSRRASETAIERHNPARIADIMYDTYKMIMEDYIRDRQ